MANTIMIGVAEGFALTADNVSDLLNLLDNYFDVPDAELPHEGPLHIDFEGGHGCVRAFAEDLREVGMAELIEFKSVCYEGRGEVWDSGGDMVAIVGIRRANDNLEAFEFDVDVVGDDPENFVTQVCITGDIEKELQRIRDVATQAKAAVEWTPRGFHEG